MDDMASRGAPDSEFSEVFVSGMRDRMAVSYFKYGACAEAFPHKTQAHRSVAIRLQRYLDTGNTEWLIDVANFAMIEYMHPSVEGAHFRPTDSDESPGRPDLTGDMTRTRNAYLVSPDDMDFAG